MKYFSMFSGIGGFEYGMQRGCIKDLAKNTERQEKNKEIRNTERLHRQCANRYTNGLSCVGFSELDKYATTIYKKHFGGHKEYGDCTKINWSEVENFDCLVGGFPCQAFSIAGKRGGFDDTRGTLFFEIARCLREKQPRLCVLENVKGLLSHDKGATFFTIISTLDELGYDCEWQVLNSKNFGVPQNRERVFIVGHLRGTGGRKVFPIGGENQKSCEIFGRVEAINGHDYLKRCYSVSGVSPTLPTCAGGNHEGKFAVPILTPDRIKKRQNGRRFKEDGEPSFTLTAQDKHGVYDGCRIRRLTPTECERLQGFPDGWTKIEVPQKSNVKKFLGIKAYMSDSQRYKCLGNAVTTNVITAIFIEIFGRSA